MVQNKNILNLNVGWLTVKFISNDSYDTLKIILIPIQELGKKYSK